jgi:hypothetical protein
MNMELSAINAIVTRLSNPEINLAAYGGFVFPIALTIEAPIIMLMAALTALSRDWTGEQSFTPIPCPDDAFGPLDCTCERPHVDL